jgi:uncharacterized protein with PIN domain
MSNLPRFISDVMLGSLAKWLRILGFDTLYFNNIDDNELIKTAKQQDRILLTRDTGIARRKGVDKLILINSEDMFEQLKEVLRGIPGTPYLSLGRGTKIDKYGVPGIPFQQSRCAECNGELVVTDKGAVADAVPEYVFLNRNSFFRCSDCGKVYWDGSHRKLIDEKIREILGEIKWKPSEKD